MSGGPRSVSLLLAGAALLMVCALPSPAAAVGSCGGQKDSCNCGMNNPYPCCDNGSNCTWWAWHSACCTWGLALPGWGNANTWSKYAKGYSKVKVVGSPKVGSIATSTKGTYGHVAWVVGVSGGKVTVSEMNCCPKCKWGKGTKTYSASFFNSGFVIKKGSGGPSCGNGKCEGGENCGNCSKDCGGCCGNGKCDNGENCKSCKKDCGGCCGNGKCDNGENCKSCKKDCGGCCGNGKCDNGENCKSCDKDCGSCCGNGKCDNGENCATCDQDCGVCCGNGKCDHGETCPTCSKDCHCQPEGALDTVHCAKVGGWAWDPDAKTPVQVDLRIDGKSVAKMVAKGAHPGHNGKGFAWSVPKGLKNGTSHAATAFAFDTQTAGKTALGERKFMCDNRTSAEGIWITKRWDASGVEVGLPPAKPPRLGLLHRHQAGDPHPVHGVTESCAEVGSAPFERLLGHTSWQLQGGHLKARLQVEGDDVRQLAAGSKGSADEDVAGPLRHICLRTEATKPVVVGKAQTIRLENMRLQAGGWTSSYSSAAQGFIFGPQSDDGLTFATRAATSGELPGSGHLASWRSFESHFDAVSWQLDKPLDSEAMTLEVQVDDQFHAMHASGQLGGLRNKTVLFRLRATGDEPLPAGVKVALSRIRVRDNGLRILGPWRLERAGSRGMSADIPADADDKRAGLHVALHHAPHDYWTTGTVRALHPTVGAPFERVRGHYRQEVLGGAFRADLLVDGEAVHSWATAGRLQLDFDVLATGNEVGLALSPAVDARMDTTAHFEVVDLQWLRAGWWSASSPRCAGLRDYRPADGAIRMETSPEHIGAGLELVGAHRVLRRFASPQTELRFSYAQDLDEEALRVMVLLDGVPARLLEADGKHSEKVLIQTDPFRTVAFAMAPRVAGIAVPRSGWAEFRDIQVRSQGGSWQAARTLPAAAPVIRTLADVVGGDVSPRGGSSGGTSSGCVASPVGVPGFAPIALLWLLMALVLRRVSAPGRQGRT